MHFAFTRKDYKDGAYFVYCIDSLKISIVTQSLLLLQRKLVQFLISKFNEDSNNSLSKKIKPKIKHAKEPIYFNTFYQGNLRQKIKQAPF